MQAAALEAQSPKHQTGREVPRMPSNVTILVCLYPLGSRLRLVHHALTLSPSCQIPEVLAEQSEYDLAFLNTGPASSLPWLWCRELGLPGSLPYSDSGTVE